MPRRLGPTNLQLLRIPGRLLVAPPLALRLSEGLGRTVHGTDQRMTSSMRTGRTQSHNEYQRDSSAGCG